MGDCTTCLYKDECDGPCLGYVMDDETQSGYDAYMELQGDIERDERGED